MDKIEVWSNIVPVNIKSNHINIILGLVEIIKSKHNLSRAGTYFIVQYQKTVVLLLAVDVVVD